MRLTVSQAVLQSTGRHTMKRRHWRQILTLAIVATTFLWSPPSWPFCTNYLNGRGLGAGGPLQFKRSPDRTDVTWRDSFGERTDYLHTADMLLVTDRAFRPSGLSESQWIELVEQSMQTWNALMGRSEE